MANDKIQRLKVYAQLLTGRLKGEVKSQHLREFIERDLRKTNKKIEDSAK